MYTYDQQLMQTAPELLEALGLRPGSLQQEIANMEKMDKLKVDTVSSVILLLLLSEPYLQLLL